jgi:hypothetical protein
LIQDLGLGYHVSIQACENGSVLYRKQYAIIDHCPISGEARYVSGFNKVAKKVLKHFPFIPRLNECINHQTFQT